MVKKTFFHTLNLKENVLALKTQGDKLSGSNLGSTEISKLTTYQQVKGNHVRNLNVVESFFYILKLIVYTWLILLLFPVLGILWKTHILKYFHLNFFNSFFSDFFAFRTDKFAVWICRFFAIVDKQFDNDDLDKIRWEYKWNI